MQPASGTANRVSSLPKSQSCIAEAIARTSTLVFIFICRTSVYQWVRWAGHPNSTNFQLGADKPGDCAHDLRYTLGVGKIQKERRPQAFQNWGGRDTGSPPVMTDLAKKLSTIDLKFDVPPTESRIHIFDV
ncbi:hypothetical protein CC2G_011354 [Coprinopsis cinerea AmutBmut pab1-1]|nr:hypothetical protein CC2G_011354 [Coprinopsis cinerea AmutBmut pab1-1]